MHGKDGRIDRPTALQPNPENLYPKKPTWTPKVCKIMAFMASIMGLGLIFYILLGLGKT